MDKSVSNDLSITINNPDLGIELSEQSSQVKWRIKALGKINWPAINNKLMKIMDSLRIIITFFTRLIFVSILNTLTIVLLFSFFILVILSILSVVSFLTDLLTNNENSFASDSISWVIGGLINLIGLLISFLGKLVGAVISFIGDSIGSIIDSLGETIQSYSSNENCQLGLVIILLITIISRPAKEGLKNVKKLSHNVFQFMIRMTVWAFNSIGVYKNKSMTGGVAAAVSEPITASTDVVATVIDVVINHTGYPADFVELDQDLERELGIDTVKQAVIMADIREKFSLLIDEEFVLSDYPTLNHMIAYIATMTSGEVVEEAAEESEGDKSCPICSTENASDSSACSACGFNKDNQMIGDEEE